LKNDYDDEEGSGSSDKEVENMKLGDLKDANGESTEFHLFAS
jgi:hypothetical protein